jgi:hypothetical protein
MISFKKLFTLLLNMVLFNFFMPSTKEKHARFFFLKNEVNLQLSHIIYYFYIERVNIFTKIWINNMIEIFN